MKINKALILILIGVLLFGSGIFLYSKKSNNNTPVRENLLLSRDEAVSVMTELINTVINIYEKPSSTFKLINDDVEKSETFSITKDNYKKVISSIFSENGIKQLENTTFNDKKFVTSNESTILLLKNIPISNQYSNSEITINTISISEKRISCEATFSSYNIDLNGDLNYYVITKTVVAIKSGNNWVIDNFEYANNY